MKRLPKKTKSNGGIMILFLILAVTGCVMPFHVGGSAEPGGGTIWKVAILPFENLSKEEGAGDIAGNLFLVKMLHTGAFIIADPGLVEEALSTEGVRLTAHIPLSNLQGLGKKLDIPLILMGSVLEDEMQVLSGVGGGGQVPSVSVTVRLLEVSTGRVLWADAQSKRGTDYEKIFGLGRVYSTSRLMEIITEDMVASLERFLSAQEK